MRIRQVDKQIKPWARNNKIIYEILYVFGEFCYEHSGIYLHNILHLCLNFNFVYVLSPSSGMVTSSVTKKFLLLHFLENSYWILLYRISPRDDTFSVIKHFSHSQSFVTEPSILIYDMGMSRVYLKTKNKFYSSLKILMLPIIYLKL